MSVKIRKARESDHDTILRMDRACFPDDSPLKIEDGDLWWVAVDEKSGELVGYAGAQEWEGREPGRTVERAIYLHRAGVMKSHRGQGIHSRLTRVRVAEARRRNMHEVWSLTAHSNTPSMNTLIACGFTTWIPADWSGYREPWKPDDVDPENGWVFWRKSLRWKGAR